MTIREYIEQRLQAFPLTTADFADITASGVDLERDYNADSALTANRALISTIERLALQPKPRNITEGGFSVGWDYGDIGKLYAYLCRKYCVPTDDGVSQALGVSTIRDISNMW